MIFKSRTLSRFVQYWKTLGTGMITGASNDDPSAMITFIQAGAGFGIPMVGLPLFTIPLLACLLEMCGRIGLASSKGLTGILRAHYPRTILYVIVGISVPALLLNMAADISGIGAVAHLVFPGIHAAFFSLIFITVFMAIMFKSSYRKFTSLLKYFSLILLVYALVPFFEKPHWGQLLRSFFTPAFTWDKSVLVIIVAMLGANVSPYMFFWQTSMVQGDTAKEKKHPILTRKMMRDMRKDVFAGTFFSNLIAFFILFTSGTVLYNAGIHEINTLDIAARSLEPLAGKLVYVLFAVGVIGTGSVIIPVLSSSISFIITEAFDLQEGFNKRPREAKTFYATIAISLVGGLVMNFAGLNPIKALLLVTTLYGLLLPVIIAMILHIANNEKIMGVHRNSRWSNIGGITILLISSTASAGMFYFEFIG